MDNYDDYCYECGGYGDDYYYDEETDELVSNCDNCPYNPWGYANVLRDARIKVARVATG